MFEECICHSRRIGSSEASGDICNRFLHSGLRHSVETTVGGPFTDSLILDLKKVRIFRLFGHKDNIPEIILQHL